MRKAIFIHSLFRAGSTYLFNKFRVNDNTWPFYEPLHHDLVRLRSEQLDIWKFNQATTKIMNHPSLDKPHFYEYKDVFSKGGTDELSFFDVKFSYHSYAKPPKALKLYINNLTSSVSQDKLPVLQFNRTSLRLDWMRKNHSEGLHVFLLRDPFDQFESYVQRGEVGKNNFLALNLIIISQNKELFTGLSFVPCFEKNDDITKTIDDAMQMSKDFSLSQHFQFFLHIWFKSLLDAVDTSTHIVDMDRMNNLAAYRKVVNDLFDNYWSGSAVSFDDYSIKKYKTFSLDLNVLQKELVTVLRLYEPQMSLSALNYITNYIQAFDATRDPCEIKNHPFSFLDLTKSVKTFYYRVISKIDNFSSK